MFCCLNLPVKKLTAARVSCTTVGANRSEGLSTYIEIFSPKKTGFFPVKNSSQNFFDFFLPLYYATFQFEVSGRYNIFKKISNLFFPHENNGPEKLLIISPNFFLTVLARLPKPAQNRFLKL